MAGRENIELDFEKLSGFCSLKAGLKDCAELMGVSERTIRNKIKEKYDISFTEYRDLKMSKTRMTLSQKALSMAKGGDRVMLIFCLKNFNKWSDTPESTQEEQDDLEFIT
ncbi:MAG: hypothetical protein OEL89_00700 [Candidatus Peregrinibacteria bacterium]|nr:hypothetical protein [Candidatus Peregrinibacteria bacterium]